MATISDLRASLLFFVLLSLSFPVAGYADLRIDPTGGVGGGPIAGRLTVTVIDELSGDPIADAFCQVGLRPGVPFAGNLGRTDSSGQILFLTPALSGPQSVTVGKEGYTYITIFEVNAAEMILPILQPNVEITRPIYEGDITSGFDITWNDGILDMALVFQTIRLRDLLPFATAIQTGDIGRFGPILVHNFPLIGDSPVPGPIYMPFQIELILYPIEVTPYVIYLEDQTVTDIFAIYGQIPLLMVLDNLLLPVPDLLSLMREFDEKGFALEEGVVVNGSGTQDLALDIEPGENLWVNVASTDPGMDVLVIALADLDGLGGFGRLMPSGFNAAPGDSAALLGIATLGEGAPGAPDYVVGAVLSGTVEGLANTAVFDRSGPSPGDTVQADAYLRVPALSASEERIDWTSVENAGAGLFPDLHRAEITLRTKVIDTGGDSTIVLTPLWVLYLAGDSTSFSLPCLGPDFPSPLIDPDSTADIDRIDLTLYGNRLGLAPGFDFDQWDLIDRTLYGTHVAWNTQKAIPTPRSPYTSVEVGARSVDIERPGTAAAPNPFRFSTTLRFHLPSPVRSVDAGIYNTAGRLVRTLFHGREARGLMEIEWDGKDDSGASLPSGVYLVRLDGGDRVFTGKVVLAR